MDHADHAVPHTSLRIAHVSATYPPYVGGTGAVVYRNAIELAKRHHEVHVFTVGSAGALAVPGAIEVHRLPPRFSIGNAPFASNLARRLTDFDVVHLHYPFFFGAEQIWWEHIRRGLTYVITYHQDVILQGPWSALEQMHHRLLGRRILAAARFVAATSMDYAEHSRLTCVPEAKLVEVPNGVDLDRFHPTVNGDQVTSDYGISPGCPLILLVATLDRAHYFKGVDVLLRAMGRLRKATLLIVGEGSLRSSYERAARDAGLASRVTFAGYVPDAALPAHFAAADVVVVPSTTAGEAFSLTALEAMATAKPVVASRLPGVRSVVEDGRTGLLATPGDATDLAAKLHVVLSDSRAARQMGSAGRRKAEARYGWDRIAAGLEQLYREVTGR